MNLVTIGDILRIKIDLNYHKVRVNDYFARNADLERDDGELRNSSTIAQEQLWKQTQGNQAILFTINNFLL